MTPLTELEIKQFVDIWYQKLDAHAPLEEILPLLSGEDCRMLLPEATLSGLASFKTWYNGIIYTFFDEVHTLKDLKISINPEGSQAHLELLVHWQARRWNAPLPTSEALAFEARQNWMIVRSSQTEQPAILTYIVRELTPFPGYPPL